MRIAPSPQKYSHSHTHSKFDLLIPGEINFLERDLAHFPILYSIYRPSSENLHFHNYGEYLFQNDMYIFEAII